jgi:hypothetical protein
MRDLAESMGVGEVTCVGRYTASVNPHRRTRGASPGGGRPVHGRHLRPAVAGARAPATVQHVARVRAHRLGLHGRGVGSRLGLGQRAQENIASPRATNAASLSVAASCQPVPVTFSSRTSSCPLNVPELL